MDSIDNDFELSTIRSSGSLDMLMTQHLDPENPFAFSMEQMVLIVDKKQIEFLHRLGGVEYIAKGLHSNTVTGLDWDEDCLTYVRLYDLMNKKEEDEHQEQHFPISMLDSETFIQRRKVFGSNILPQVEKVTLLKLMWEAFKDKTLVNQTLNSLFFFY